MSRSSAFARSACFPFSIPPPLSRSSYFRPSYPPAHSIDPISFDSFVLIITPGSSTVDVISFFFCLFLPLQSPRDFPSFFFLPEKGLLYHYIPFCVHTNTRTCVKPRVSEQWGRVDRPGYIGFFGVKMFA
ncbi:hypothetical protein M407DRAFT_201564 [Tulasnella calospora MUT 4182]|uniref:Uncharacterized protein n=1 Tax=Tulasnella calospora MUT 4182 TaxID=1051891 RepID=A0A0C3QJK4_9AGAM|nr:hypothetical protein M407DRAFT_201564 [Tulasnella calospora MUT 4182]